MRPTQIIALGFFLLILTGAILLSLPISSASGKFTPFLNSLFTATSATCITGLVVYDTATHWSLFGKTVILMMIQIGGLGFMTIATLFSFMMRRKITLRERLIMVEALNQNQIQGIVGMTQRILTVTFSVELIGAVVLATRFVPDYGFYGVYMAIFTAISAFCNAGFDLLGTPEHQFPSLTAYVHDPVVNLTIMGLIIIGGLGFLVWANLHHTRKLSDMQLHTKLVLVITGVLILLGAVAFFISEYRNPKTMGDFSIPEKILASFFQSVTPRTAGFNTIDQGGMTEISKFITVLLMFIGGSPGSTAGGIKTVTFGVVLLAVISVIRGKRDTNIFQKRISTTLIMRSMAIIVLSMFYVLVTFLVVVSVEQKPIIDCLLEVVSAFGTVGLSANLTPSLHDVSKVALSLLMFTGRVGGITLAMAMSLRSREDHSKIRYPEAKVMVG